MNTFINFFIARASSTPRTRVCFKLKCILYDNAYFLSMRASSTSEKQEINKKQRNTQVETTDVRSDFSPMSDSLPVACCPSEQQLFLTHSLFFCTLQIQGNGLFWTTVSHSLFLSFDSFTVPCSSGWVRPGRVVGSGQVRSGPVRSGWVGSSPVGSSGHWVGLLGWVGSSGPVRLSWVQSGWVDDEDGNGKSGEGKGGSGKGQVIFNNVTK